MGKQGTSRRASSNAKEGGSQSPPPKGQEKGDDGRDGGGRGRRAMISLLFKRKKSLRTCGASPTDWRGNPSLSRLSPMPQLPRL